jgi:hypothetical protein
MNKLLLKLPELRIHFKMNVVQNWLIMIMFFDNKISFASYVDF